MMKHGRKPRPGEREKHAARQAVRRAAWLKTGDGAGARSIGDPQRHHRGGTMREPESLEDQAAMEGFVLPDVSEVTRFEVIDCRQESSSTPGRIVVAYNVSVELSLQDRGRTLKVFLDDQEEEK